MAQTVYQTKLLRDTVMVIMFKKVKILCEEQIRVDISNLLWLPCGAHEYEGEVYAARAAQYFIPLGCLVSQDC